MPSRKRAAPGASPVNPQAQSSFGVQQNLGHPNLANDTSYVDWANQADYKPYDGSFDAFSTNLAGYDTNSLGYNGSLGLDPDAQYGDDSAIPNSGQLVRRNANQQLTRQSRDAWDADEKNDPSVWGDDDEEDLERRALEAKKDALAKKRQIPPFVQKISRYA